jgi:hypothetical protein
MGEHGMRPKGIGAKHRFAGFIRFLALIIQKHSLKTEFFKYAPFIAICYA